MENKNITTSITGSSRINVNETERIASIAAGLLLVGLGIRKAVHANPLGILATVAGTLLVTRGASGHCPVYNKLGIDSHEKVMEPIIIEETMVINRSKKEVYDAWRKLENLPLFMKHLKKVTEQDKKRSNWEAYIPGGLGTSIKWEAEITGEREGEYLAWRSVWNSTVDNAGEVEFKDAVSGMGTELKATISYRPPVGELGTTIARYLNDTFERMIRQDLRGFKEMMENTNQFNNNTQGYHSL